MAACIYEALQALKQLAANTGVALDADSRLALLKELSALKEMQGERTEQDVVAEMKATLDIISSALKEDGINLGELGINTRRELLDMKASLEKDIETANRLTEKYEKLVQEEEAEQAKFEEEKKEVRTVKGDVPKRVKSTKDYKRLWATFSEILSRIVNKLQRLQDGIKKALNGRKIPDMETSAVNLGEYATMLRVLEKQFNKLSEGKPIDERNGPMGEQNLLAGKKLQQRNSAYGTGFVEIGGYRAEYMPKVANSADKDEIDKVKKENKKALENAIQKAATLRIEALEKEGSVKSILMANSLKLLNTTKLVTKFVGQKTMIMQQGRDSIFSESNGGVFHDWDTKEPLDPEEVVDNLPETFKEIFVANGEAKNKLITNITALQKFMRRINVPTMGETALNGNLRLKINQYGQLLWNDKAAQGLDNAGKMIPVINPLLLISEVTPQDKDGTEKEGAERGYQYMVKMPEKLHEMVKFFTAKMLADMESSQLAIANMDDKDVTKNFGITSVEEINAFRTMVTNGWVPVSSFRADAAKDFYRNLGVEFTQNVSKEAEEVFIAGIEAFLQASLLNNGLVDELSDGAVTHGDRSRIFMKMKGYDDLGEKRSGEYDYIHEAKTAMNKLQYLAVSEKRQMPLIRRPKTAESFTMIGSKQAVDERGVEMLNMLQQRAYTIDKDLEPLLKLDDATVLAMFGVQNDVEEAMAEQHIMKQQKQRTKWQKIEREWNILKQAAEVYKGRKFYLPWGRTVSGRDTIISDLHFQESKLHREFVTGEGKVVSLNLNDPKSKRAFQIALALALDLGPDKMDGDSAVAAIEKYIDFDTMQVREEHLNKDGLWKSLQEAMGSWEKGKPDTKAFATVFDKSEGFHGIRAVMVLVQAKKMVEWAAMANTSKKEGEKPVDPVFETSFAVETDAVTSGMMLMLLQIGTDNAIKLLEKGGFFTQDKVKPLTDYIEKVLGHRNFSTGAVIEAGKKHAAELEKLERGEEAHIPEGLDEEVFYDLYTTLGVAMVGEVKQTRDDLLLQAGALSERTFEKLEDYIKALTDGGIKLIVDKDENDKAIISRITAQANIARQLLVIDIVGDLTLKNIRTIAKSPVMVYVYGASAESIGNKLTYNLVWENLMGAIERVTAGKGTAEELKKDKLLMHLLRPKTNVRYEDINGKVIPVINGNKPSFLNAVLTDDWMKELKMTIQHTFISGLNTAFNKVFGEIDTYRDAIKGLELVTFQVHKLYFDKFLNDKLQEKLGDTKAGTEVLSAKDVAEVIQKLAEQQLGHDIITYEGNEAKVYQPLDKQVKMGGKVGVEVYYQEDGSTVIANTNRKATTSSWTKIEVANTGAAPTISIHMQDGRLMTATLMRNSKNEAVWKGDSIYDAIILPLDLNNLYETNLAYNKSSLEDGFGRNIIADWIKKLAYMTSQLGEAERGQVKTMLNDALNADSKYTDEMNRLQFTVESILENIKLVAERDVQRVENSAKAFTVGHNGVDWIPEMMYKAEEAEARSRGIDKGDLDIVTGLLKESIPEKKDYVVQGLRNIAKQYKEDFKQVFGEELVELEKMLEGC